MKDFPVSFTPINLENFKDYYHNRLLCYTRRRIYEAMIRPDFNIPDNCGINLQCTENSENEFGPVNMDIIKQLQTELETKGWKTQVSYGGTMLYVFIAGSEPNIISCSGF